ncbi:tyrosine-protein phosphatase [Verrucomicrobiota bacterium]
MIDLHAHVLPEVDDGPQSLDEAVRMCRIAAGDGIERLVATPHLFAGGRGLTPDDIRSARDLLKQELEKEGIELELDFAAEVRLVENLPERIKAGEIAMVGAEGRAILLEPPRVGDCTESLCRTIFRLRLHDILPIIVHPECIEAFHSSESLAEHVVEQGALLQLTAHSVVAAFSTDRRSLVGNLLLRGMAHIVATDAHDTEHRPPILSHAHAVCREVLGDGHADLLFKVNPERILQGNRVIPLTPVDQPAPRGLEPGMRSRMRSLFDRFRTGGGPR